MLEKLFTGKVLVTDFNTLAAASAIILDFVDQEFLPSQQCNITSLCHKTNRNRLNRLIEKKHILNHLKSDWVDNIFEIKTKSMLNKKKRKKAVPKNRKLTVGN